MIVVNSNYWSSPGTRTETSTSPSHREGRRGGSGGGWRHRLVVNRGEEAIYLIFVSNNLKLWWRQKLPLARSVDEGRRKCTSFLRRRRRSSGGGGRNLVVRGSGRGATAAAAVSISVVGSDLDGWWEIQHGKIL